MSDITDPKQSGRDIPPIAISRTTTEVNPTGSWKYITPRYEDRVAPCNAGCPVGIDIEGYLYLLGLGRTKEAAELLLPACVRLPGRHLPLDDRFELIFG